MITQTKSIKPEELKKYKDITKDFDDLKLKRNTSKKMKIRYNNPDDEDKKFIIESTDAILFIRTKELNVQSKTSGYIRFIINTPGTIGTYTPYIIVKKIGIDGVGEVEEVLKFSIEVC